MKTRSTVLGLAVLVSAGILYGQPANASSTQTEARRAFVQGGTVNPTAPVVLAENAQADPAAIVAKRKATKVTYRTFIEPRRVTALGCYYYDPTGGTRYWFTGDQRSYSTIAPSYRTMMQVRVDWKKKKITLTKDVGTTKVLDRKGKVVARKRASMKQMKLTEKNVNRNVASFGLDHSATNPFCTGNGGAIRYKVSFIVWKNGNYFMFGWRQKAPHHEAFISQDSRPSQFVIKRRNHGFACLQPALCKREFLAASSGKR